MEWQVALGQQGAGLDVEAPAENRERAEEPVHAAARNSPVTACGVPVGQLTAAPWPPVSAPACPRCVEVVATYSS